MKPFFQVPTTGQRQWIRSSVRLSVAVSSSVVPVGAGNAGVLLDRDVEALEQGLERVPKADVTERIERRRRDQQRRRAKSSRALLPTAIRQLRLPGVTSRTGAGQNRSTPRMFSMSIHRCDQ